MKYTKEQIIQFTIDNLSAINIPARLAEQIGVPIQKAITNLEIVSAMFEEEKKKPELETPEIDDIDFGGEEDERETDAE